MDNVEESQENQVNAMLVEVDRNIEQLRVRSKEVEEVAQKQIENAIEWERTNIATDTKYSALCHRALNELAEGRVVELEKEKYGRNACSAKAEEEMQMQENCAQKKEEVDEVRTVVRDRTDEARSLEEIINVLCDRITTRKSYVEQRAGRLAKEEKIEKDSIRKYEEILGLKVEAVEDQSILLTFTSIDVNNPTDPYMATIIITEDSDYQAVHCRPSVVEFDRLSEALHSRNMGLEDFVKELREAFVRYVTLATS